MAVLPFGGGGYGYRGPYRRLVIQAVGAAALSLSASGAANQIHGCSADAAVSLSVQGTALRKQMASASPGWAGHLFGRATVVQSASAAARITLSASGHPFRNLFASAVSGIHLSLHGVPASVLVSGQCGFSAHIAGGATRKRFASSAGTFAGFSMAGQALMKRGTTGVSTSLSMAVAGSAQIRRAGETHWYMEADADAPVRLALSADPALVVLKLPGGRLAGFSARVEGRPHVKLSCSSSVPVAVALAGVARRRLYPEAQASIGLAAAADAVRKHMGSANAMLSLSPAGGMVQKHAVFGACGFASAMQAASSMQHAGAAGAEIDLQLAGDGTLMRVASGDVGIAFSLHGGVHYRWPSAGNAVIGFSASGFAYGNIGVDAPACRTAVVGRENRSMTVPGEAREMEVIC